MPKISVIIPVYNTEKYLKECIDSVVNQTLQDIEIVCVDDGSTDSSLDILNNYKKDPRLVVLSQKHQGAGCARNLALEVAQGEYLAFIDSDDFYDIDFCERMYNKAVATDSDVVVCSARSYNVNDNIYNSMPSALVQEYLPSKDVFNYKDMPKYIFCFSQNWNWNKLFKREFISKNNINFQNLYRTNDLLFTCKALVHAERISIINEELITYRVGNSTNSQSTNYLYPLDFYEAFKTLRNYLISIDKYEDVRQSYINWALCGLVYNIDSLKDKSINNKVGRFLYNEGLEAIGLASINADEIYKQRSYEIFWKQYYKYIGKPFVFKCLPLHYLIQLCNVQIWVKRRRINA